MDTSTQLQKEEIRTEMKRLRAELAAAPKTKQDLDVQITSRLLEMPAMQDADIILVYESYKTEVDTHELIGILQDLGKTVVVPHVESMEPPVMTLRLQNSIRSHVKPSAIQCAVIPGLAFDPQLNRIGFGKGFFDILMHDMICPKIGLAYDFQIVQNVPVAQHDEKVNHIITPTAIYE